MDSIESEFKAAAQRILGQTDNIDRSTQSAIDRYQAQLDQARQILGTTPQYFKPPATRQEADLMARYQTNDIEYARVRWSIESGGL